MAKTALVAEDDPDLLEMVTDALKSTGMEVRSARNGAELIELLAEDEPLDLLVTDISMPWMSGAQAALTARRAGRAMPIVWMTALRGDNLERQIAPLGGSNEVVLPKPFGLAELLSAVEAAIAPQG